MSTDETRRWIALAAEATAIGLTYYLLARLGQTLAIEPGNVTPIWPASGFALAVVLWRGYRAWAGIWLGSVLGNTWAFFDISTFADAARTLPMGIGIGTGAALQACLGAYLIRCFCTNGEPFGSIRDVFCFVGTQSGACLSSASIGVCALCLGSVVPWTSCGYTWLTWFLGDAIGIILIAPLLLTWRGALRPFRDAKSAAEALTILLLGLLTSFLAFGGIFQPSLTFLPLPLILWAAVRGDQFAVSSTVLAVWSVAIWWTSQGGGPFATEDRNISFMLLQLYVAITLVTGSAVTATLTEHKRTEQILRDTNKTLLATEEGVRLAAVAFNTHDVIVITDKNGTILQVNPSFTELTGYQPDEVIGKTPRILRSGLHDEGFYREMWVSIRAVGYWEGEIWNKRKDGRRYLARLTITCVRDKSGETTHFVADSHDITEAIEAAANREAINAARKVQESLFPSEPPFVPGFDIAGAVHTAEHASGDYFDFIPTGDGSIGILVADVSSHGLGPALLMAQMQAYIRALADSYDDPAALLNHANRLFAQNSTENFVTLFLGRLDIANRTLVHCGAGHQGYVIGANGGVEVLKSTGIPLGIDPGFDVSSAPPVALKSGDIILLPTDGIEEAKGPDDSMFGRERAFDIVRIKREESAAEIVEALFHAARAYTEGQNQEDDITAVVVKVLPTPGETGLGP